MRPPLAVLCRVSLCPGALRGSQDLTFGAGLSAREVKALRDAEEANGNAAREAIAAAKAAAAKAEARVATSEAKWTAAKVRI